MLFSLLIKLFTLTGIAYAGYAVLVFAAQRQVIYPGTSIEVDGRTPAGVVPIKLVTSSGSGEAWFMPPTSLKQGERRGVVIFFHGNGEVIAFLPKQVEGFREMGLGVLLVEYPGFGRSEGEPNEASITETAIAAYDEVLKREEVDPERIVIFGRSLGGGGGLCARRQATECGADPAVGVHLHETICTPLLCARISCQGPVRQRCGGRRLQATDSAPPRQPRHRRPARA